MSEPLPIAIAGIGRMGHVHVSNAMELARRGTCRIAALVDSDPRRLTEVASECGDGVATFTSVEDLARSGLCRATFIVTPTEHHREHAATLLRAGHRVLLEKPLTGTLEGDRAFAAELDRDHPDGVMIAFQRRFDPALQYAHQLIRDGLIGRVFKIYSALEDSSPAPNGYQSNGILPDMSIHNVDEILWLTGRMPVAALAVGSRVYSHRLTTCIEDFDDAFLHLWFDNELIAQVQVSRNHVAGYRVETAIYGEEGEIQIGHFRQTPHEITVQAFGRRFSPEPLRSQTFGGESDAPGTPEFVARFKKAYAAELAKFIDCCRTERAFPITHNDALRAQIVISAGMQTMFTAASATAITEPARAAAE